MQTEPGGRLSWESDLHGKTAVDGRTHLDPAALNTLGGVFTRILPEAELFAQLRPEDEGQAP